MRHCEKCGGTLFDADECVVCTLYDLRARFAAAERQIAYQAIGLEGLTKSLFRETERAAAAEKDRDYAKARLDLILDDAVRFAERDAPPLAFAKDALLVPIEAYNERANQAFTFAGAVKMLQAALKEQTECSANERIQRRAAEERARKAADERTAQIVAWLRHPDRCGIYVMNKDQADAIERGDYHS